ncbi:MAG TPA: gamma-glutamylcyclotransferase family protein, partial [Trebonia sp.]
MPETRKLRVIFRQALSAVVTGRLFVYGTLMPGQPRWHLLAPLTTPAQPERAEAAGHLYRTPYGWPAAVFDLAASSPVPGLVITLRNPADALPVLDEIEGTGAGLFRRRLITTTAG